jgi:hypothetical protein
MLNSTIIDDIDINNCKIRNYLTYNHIISLTRARMREQWNLIKMLDSYDKMHILV